MPFFRVNNPVANRLAFFIPHDNKIGLVISQTTGSKSLPMGIKSARERLPGVADAVFCSDGSVASATDFFRDAGAISIDETSDKSKLPALVCT